MQGIRDLQHMMRFSAYNHLTSRAVRIPDEEDRSFLRDETHANGYHLPPGAWVRIKLRGLYHKDLGLVVSNDAGDLITIAVIPRFTFATNGKRKSGRASPALLNSEALARLTPKQGFYFRRARKFHPTGLELLLTPSSHGVKLELYPHEEELWLFELSTFNFRAVQDAYYKIARHLWRAGDRIRIRDGNFEKSIAFLRDIDWQKQSAVVELQGSDTLALEVRIDDVERQFMTGDLVRVAVGVDKGKKGIITSILGETVTVIEDTPRPVSHMPRKSCVAPTRWVDTSTRLAESTARSFEDCVDTWEVEVFFYCFHM